MTEKNLSLSLKGTGEKYREPLLTLRGDTIEEFLALIEQAHAKDLFTAVGRAAEAFDRGALMGAKLGARTIEVNTAEDVDKAAEELAEKPAEKKPAPRTRAKATPKATEEPEKGAEELEAAAARPEADKLAEAQPAPEEEKPAPPKNPRKTMPAGVPKPKWMQ